MGILEIIEAPHPILEKTARAVRDDEFGPELKLHTSDMAATMYAAPGVGLAAPQIADSRRIIVIDPGEKADRGKRFFAMVNPEIIDRSDETIQWWETCLSVPELEVEVTRSKRITVKWQDPLDGSERVGGFEEYEAVIVQHELDHLQGTVLLDRVSGFKRRRYIKNAAKRRKKVFA